MRHPEVHDSLCYIARQREVITLSGLLFNYNTISPTAQSDGKIQTVNGRLQDRYISGVWQNPYLLQTAVAISPSVTRYNLTYGSVLLPANLFQSNNMDPSRADIPGRSPGRTYTIRSPETSDSGILNKPV